MDGIGKSVPSATLGHRQKPSFERELGFGTVVAERQFIWGIKKSRNQKMEIKNDEKGWFRFRMGSDNDVTNELKIGL